VIRESNKKKRSSFFSNKGRLLNSSTNDRVDGLFSGKLDNWTVGSLWMAEKVMTMRPK
jgi:hypothetical protein